MISPREGSASRPSTGSSKGAGGRWLGLCTSRWTRRASGFLAGQGRRRDSRLLCQSEPCEPTWRGPFLCGSPLKCLSASGRPSWVNLLQKQRLPHWLVAVIAAAYSEQGFPVPGGLVGHSTRGVATSWAALRGVPLADICSAASWSSPCTFARFYRLNVASATSLSGSVLLTGAQR